MSDKNLDELVDLYLEDDLEEISTTAGVPGYQTPMAFTGGLPKYEKRRKKTAMSGGYKLAKSLKPNEMGFAIKLTNSSTKLTGIKYLPNGCNVSSETKPLSPFILML